jgi:hypothetical protein
MEEAGKEDCAFIDVSGGNRWVHCERDGVSFCRFVALAGVWGAALARSVEHRWRESMELYLLSLGNFKI